jgi:hypothetical protein
MSTENKKPFKRDQTLNDATSGQLGEPQEPMTTSLIRLEKWKILGKRLPGRFLEMDDILIQLESPFTYCFFPQMCKLLFMS